MRRAAQAAPTRAKGSMVTWWQALLLGMLQGLTEFLPVSSSGHLVLLEKAFGLPEDLLAFDVFVHLATVAAIVAAFRREILAVVRERRDWIPKLIAACVPVGALYLVLKLAFKVDMGELRALTCVGAAWVAAGLFIAAGEGILAEGHCCETVAEDIIRPDERPALAVEREIPIAFAVRAVSIEKIGTAFCDLQPLRLLLETVVEH